MKTKLVILVAIGTLLPAITSAATPTAYLESSEIIGTGKQFRAYRVPTKDINGKIKYYDLTVTFTVLDDGKIDTTAATIVSVVSPNVSALKFIPGTYKDSAGNYTCIVTAATLNGGRKEGTVACHQYSSDFSADWISGPIAGHPFELDLLAAGIDQIAGYQNFSWGKIGYTSGTWWYCMNTGDVISATQVGNSIRLSGYDQGNVQKCGVTLIKQ